VLAGQSGRHEEALQRAPVEGRRLVLAQWAERLTVAHCFVLLCALKFCNSRTELRLECAFGAPAVHFAAQFGATVARQS